MLCWMILPAAQPVWDRVRLLQYTAFPWRWLGPITVCIAMLVGSIGPRIARLARWRAVVFAGAMALLIVPNLPHLRPREFVDVDLSFWTPQQIASRGIEAIQPGGIQAALDAGPAGGANLRPAEIVSGNAQIEQTSRTPVSWSGVVTAKTPVTAQLSLAYFPEWRIQVDDMPVQSRPSDNVGLIRFDVPPGTHRVNIAWTRTAVSWIGDAVSLVALLLFAFLVLPGRQMAKSRRSDLTSSGADSSHTTRWCIRESGPRGWRDSKALGAIS